MVGERLNAAKPPPFLLEGSSQSNFETSDLVDGFKFLPIVEEKSPSVSWSSSSSIVDDACTHF